MKKAKTVTMVVFYALLVMLAVSGCEKTKESQKEISTRDLTGAVVADSIEQHVKWLENMGTRFALSPNRRQVADRIRKKLVGWGYQNASLDSFRISVYYNGSLYDQWQYNVIAKLEGSADLDSVCIIGGHYDNTLRSTSGNPFEGAYGANDNASGTAAMLEMARAMKKIDYKPRNDIMFIAYGAEELGLLGSKSHSETASVSGMKIIMMLNNDMIGYEPSDNSTGWKVDIMDYTSSGILRYKAQELVHKYTLLDHVHDNTYNKQSDSYPYSQKGYPALFFFSYSFDPNYHTLLDISQNCNFKYCAEVVKISAALLVDANTFD
ncbi:MAG: M20/M25/M40 family metallo-hydrolase [Bacteroidales bacterium]